MRWKFDCVALAAAALAALMLWATINAWDITSSYGRNAGLAASFALVGAAAMFIGSTRGTVAHRIGQTIFMLGTFAFLYIVYVYMVIPDFLRKI